MNFKTKKILAVIVLTISLGNFAKADLTAKINSIISESSQKKVQYSIDIVKADPGRTVYSYNANTPMVPASNMKIIVSAAALKFLGPNFQYKTRIGLCGDTLAVIASGDPLLGDEKTDTKYGREAGWVFEDIAAKLKQNSITAIKDIVVDSSIFDDQRIHPNWPTAQLNQWYACEVSGLNYNGNCVDMVVENNGGIISLSIKPKTDFISITNKVAPISKGSGAVGAYRQATKPNNLIIKGKCRKKQGPFAVAIERPAAFFGFLLAENLASEQIDVKGRLLEKAVGTDCDFKILAEYTTSISDCLSRCNKDSFGLAAEAIFKSISANINPDKKNGSWENSRAIISTYLLGIGIETDQFYIDDGRGLSRQNKLSANAITKVLLDVYKSRDWSLYKNSLAAGGIDGTTAKYFKEEKYKGKIFGKTGYIDGVKSFSGVCSTAEGDYIFSILTNKANGKTRKAINDIAKAIVDSGQ